MQSTWLSPSKTADFLIFFAWKSGFGLRVAPLFTARTLQGGLPSRGGGGVKNGRKSEVLRMSLPIVENVRTSSDILLDTSRGLQLPYRKKSKKSSFFDRFFKLSYFSVFFCLGSLAAVIYRSLFGAGWHLKGPIYYSCHYISDCLQ